MTAAVKIDANDQEATRALNADRALAELGTLRSETGRLRSELTELQQQKKHLEELLDGMLTSDSWRLTAPLRWGMKLKRQLLPLLRWKRHVATLRPERGLKPLTGRRFEIQEHGARGELYFTGPTRDANAIGGCPERWTVLRARLRSSRPHHFFYLYPREANAGFSDGRRTWIALERDTDFEQVVKLPQGCAALRLDCFASAGDFEFERLEFREIGSVQVFARILARQLRPALSNPMVLLRKLRQVVALFREGGLTAIRMKLFAGEHAGNYAEWVERYDTISAADAPLLRKATAALRYRPLISVVMPTYNSPERYLRAAIDSVRAQAYPDWELCIADDASTEPHVRRVLEEYARLDPRIKVAFCAENGHIAKASNEALALASGEFVALLDHDDALTVDALLCVAMRLNQTSGLDLIYSDEDKMTGFGMRFNPYFKSDWNPDLLLAQNYVCHFTVVRTALVRELKGFRSEVNGAQDWDLILRVSDRCGAGRIAHIPHVLYHWRVIEGSTAQSTAHKPYVLAAQKRAVEDHLLRNGHDRAAVEILHGIAQLRVVFPVPEPAPLVSIIIPTKNGLDHLQLCVESIRAKTNYPHYEIVIVDNGSSEPETLAYLADLERNHVARVLHDPSPFNYSRLNNDAVRHARGEYIAFLNNDIEVITPGWLTEMVGQCARAGIGAVGARLWYPNDLLQHAGVILGIGGVAGHNHKCRHRHDPGYFNRAILPQNLSAVTAACMVVNKKVFEAVGGFNEQELAVAFNDVDLCLKIRAAGHLIVYTPYAELYHHESASRGYENTPSKTLRAEGEIAAMRRFWGALLENDPYYNPNLTLGGEDFSFSFPPRVARPWRG